MDYTEPKVDKVESEYENTQQASNHCLQKSKEISRTL